MEHQHPFQCTCDIRKFVELSALIDELAEALNGVNTWFEYLKSDQHEKLVHNQTLESASENWDKLEQPSLDMAPIQKVLEKYKAFKGRAE